MPVERPTFSESWYRVAGLRPRLRSTVQIYRQHYRGRMWFVLQDPSNNQFYRQNEAAHHFVALLDGRRTIADTWQLCNEQLGDGAPTQGEAIQLLGQLYTSNLIQCELPPDAQGLFARFQKRRHREVKGYLSNLMFIRIPLFDPDRFLDRWVKLFGMLYSLPGFFLWLFAVTWGLHTVITNSGALFEQGNKVLNVENLPLLYLSFVFIKVIHEFGHGFACKKFGQLAGGGEVHVMGIMFLVFTPLPYVDASSSWAFRSKWHRVVVGTGGMFVELMVAGIAAVVWGGTQAGTVHSIAYNMMFIASVSTLLFNANPLLRYDGYYILSDLVEIPNLSQRAKQYLYYLIRKYAWGVRNPRNPAHTSGERAWFVFYGIASTIYRVFICARILLFVSKRVPTIGFILACAAVVTWVFVPLGKFIHYLLTNGELMRVRGRAIISTVVTVAIIIVGLGMIPAADRQRMEGVVEPVSMELVVAKTPGRVIGYLPNRTDVQAGEQVVIAMENPELATELASLRFEREGMVTQRRLAQQERKLAEAQALGVQIAAHDAKIADRAEQIANLMVRPNVDGTWVAPMVDRLEGAYLQRLTQVGMVADLSVVIIRCTVGQNDGPMLMDQATAAGELICQIRVKGRPEDQIGGRATPADIVRSGRKQLPFAALGYTAGGSMATVQTERGGTETMENFFEIRVTPDGGGTLESGRVLLPGQRVVVRFDMPKKPLMSQWLRSLRQLFQRRGRTT